MNENWVVLRLNDSDRIIQMYEYEDMEDARESFDEEVEVFGYKAALMPAWMYHQHIASIERLKEGYTKPLEGTVYDITSDLIGNSEPCTLDEIRAIVSTWHYEGWRLEVAEWVADVRLYAYREDSDEPTPSNSVLWSMVTDDYGYIVIATEKE